MNRRAFVVDSTVSQALPVGSPEAWAAILRVRKEVVPANVYHDRPIVERGVKEPATAATMPMCQDCRKRTVPYPVSIRCLQCQERFEIEMARVYRRRYKERKRAMSAGVTA